MKNFDCDPAWPVCLYDYSFKAKIVSQYVYKATPRLSNFMVEDHFYPPNNKGKTPEQKLEMRK